MRMRNNHQFIWRNFFQGRACAGRDGGFHCKDAIGIRPGGGESDSEKCAHRSGRILDRNRKKNSTRISVGSGNVGAKSQPSIGDKHLFNGYSTEHVKDK